MPRSEIPTNILLTGAGFTKNFGGLLADDLWSDIFNSNAVRDCEGLAKRVSDHAPDFEKAYQDIVRRDPSSREAAAVRDATATAFTRLDDKLRDPQGEQTRVDTHALTGHFLSTFMAPGPGDRRGLWFTLNQDLFPERFLCGGGYRPVQTRLPGFRNPHGDSASYIENGDMAPLSESDHRRAPDAGETAAGERAWLACPGLQLVKLHGSQNWMRSDGSGLMVLGYEKAAQIDEEPILRWYWSIFRDIMLAARRRLVIVGYSFRDLHVNAVIAESIAAYGTELVVLDPRPFAKVKEQLQANDADHSGAQIVRRIEEGRQSQYYATTLRALFPPDRHGEVTTEWAALKTLLREPLH